MILEGQSPYDRVEDISKAQHGLLLVIIVGFFAFFVWSWFSPLDLVSMASGTVKPVNKIQTIQHLEGGIVNKILVKEGQHVLKGQDLVELETMNSRSSYAEILAKVNSLISDRARLFAEINADNEVAFDNDFLVSNPQLVERSRALFKARRNQLMSALQAQKSEISVRREAVKEIATRISFSEKRLLLVREQNEIEKLLITSSLSNRYDHLENLKEMNQLESDIAENKATLAKAKASLNQARSNLESTQDKYNEEVHTAYAETRSLLDQSVQRLNKFKDSLERTVLRAPMDGVIKNLYVATRGGVVAPGGTVIDMVPGKDGVIIEAKLPPQDIGHIQQGQSVFVQLASGEANTYGRLMGEVASLSPDTITTDEGEVFYIVRVLVDKSYFEKGDKVYKLSTGVLVTVGIITGKRSVLEYILSPFVQNLSFALTER